METTKMIFRGTAQLIFGILLIHNTAAVIGNNEIIRQIKLKDFQKLTEGQIVCQRYGTGAYTCEWRPSEKKIK